MTGSIDILENISETWDYFGMDKEYTPYEMAEYYILFL